MAGARSGVPWAEASKLGRGRAGVFGEEGNPQCKVVGWLLLFKPTPVTFAACRALRWCEPALAREAIP
jgi:hypothetical protein